MHLNYRIIIIIPYIPEIQEYIQTKDLLIKTMALKSAVIGVLFILKITNHFFDSFGRAPDKCFLNEVPKPTLYHKTKI